MATDIDIDRHDGPPIRTLGEVRRRHNVVGAFGDITTAREAIGALEAAGVDPGAISLLGAWPDEGNGSRSPIPLRGRHATTVAGAVAVGAAGFLASNRSPRWTAASALLGGSLGAIIGRSLGLGRSEAWSDTYIVDSSGNFAVGVHSDDSDEILLGAQVLGDNRALALNRFGNSSEGR
jgi:hypothetical protein